MNNIPENINFVLITVKDNAIGSVASELSFVIKKMNNLKAIIHSSGTKGLSELNAVKSDIFLAAMHPYQTFFSPDAELFRDIYWGIESEAYDSFSQFAEFLGGKSIKLEINNSHQRYLYHASAVAASNYLNTILSVSKGFCDAADLTFDITKPIIEQTLRNIYSNKNAFSLTGPIARADYETIKTELEKIAENENNITPFVYLSLATLEAAYSKNYFTVDSYIKIRDLLNSFLI